MGIILTHRPGCILGPVIGGSLADSASWRWAFYINLLIFAAGAPIILFILEPYNPDPSRTFGRKLKEMDWVGIVLNAAIYTTFVIGFTFGGVQWAWSDGRTIAVIVVWATLMIAFGVQQTFSIFTTPEARIFPIDFLKNRDLVLQYISVSAAATGLFIPIYYIPIYFAFTRNDTAVDAAVRLLPFMTVTITFMMINGILLPRLGYYAPWSLGGGIFMLAGGAALYAVLKTTTTNSEIYGLSVLAAIGTGLIGQSPYSVAQAKVPVNRIADAVGFINQAQIGAIAIALTITGAVFQNTGFKNISDAVDGLGFTAQDIHEALAGAKSAIFETASEEVKAAVVAAIVDAIRQGFVLLITAGSVAIVVSVLMKYERIFMETSAGA
jgi:MFS family permease